MNLRHNAGAGPCRQCREFPTTSTYLNPARNPTSEGPPSGIATCGTSYCTARSRVGDGVADSGAASGAGVDVQAVTEELEQLIGGQGHASILELVRTSQYYCNLSGCDAVKYIAQGMRIHPEPEGYLTCRHCRGQQNKGPITFQSLEQVREHFERGRAASGLRV